MQLSTLLSFLYPPPPSIFINAISFVSFASLASSGLNEIKGKHLRYSKFFNAIINNNNSNITTNNKDNKESKNEVTVPSRVGMFIVYAPAAAVAAATLFFLGGLMDARFQLLCMVLCVHYSKRVFEVLFIHQYSGRMLLESAIPITLSYTISTITMIYAQYLSQNLPEPTIDLKLPGLALFIIGIAGNFYHHFLLSKLRKKDDKGYKIPRGGLFELVICPHYLFEILGFYGVFLIAQTLYSLCFALGTTFYLVGRSSATREWYLSKFENFPPQVKALIPYIF